MDRSDPLDEYEVEREAWIAREDDPPTLVRIVGRAILAEGTLVLVCLAAVAVARYLFELVTR